MNNNVKNENTSKINSININQNINIEKDLDDLIKYGKWELSLISSLKSEKLSKKNLLLIDKEWLLNWKQLSGYNNIKSQIYNYLMNIQKTKNDEAIIESETKKLKDIWNNNKLKYNIDISNINNIPELDNKKYLLHINKNKTLINAKENFDIISSDIFDIFKKYLDKTSNIKVGGLFSKKKLLLPFNYNDKNINYIYINMIFIINNKNDFEEILFEFPKLKITIIEKIRKEISNKNISEFIKDINNNERNIKDYFFLDDDGTQYIYKAFFKNKKIQNNINKEQNEIKEENELNNLDSFDIKDILNFDINKLTKEQIENKIREIEKETLKQLEIENNLNEQENLLLQGNENNLYQIEYNKYETQINQIKSKIDNTINQIKSFEEKNNKENLMKIKLEEIKKRENKLKSEEKDLIKREKELNNDDINNQEKKKELLNKQKEINQKEKILKEKEDLENERLTKELEDEIKQLENQVSLSKKDSNKNNNNSMDIVDEAEEDNNSLNENPNNNNNKYIKRNSHQIEKPFQKLNKLNTSNNSNNKNPKLERYNTQNYENINNKGRMSLPNFNLRNKLHISHEIDEINEKIIIDKNMILPGLKKINPVNLNSIIQCFIHLKEITEGILNLEKNDFFENKTNCNLSQEYLKIIKALFYPENEDIYSLNDFWKLMISIDKMNNNLKNKLYIDSKLLIDFLIKELHKELNTKKNIIKNSINNIYESQNEKEALCKYLEEFTKNNNSLISKNFYGLIKHKIICQTCKTEKYKFELYTYLNFNLSQIKNFFSKEDKQNKQKNKLTLKLEDCFDYYNKPEYLVGDEGLYCKKCKEKTNTTVLKSIYSSHPIIPIIFERDINDKLNKDKIDFPEEIDLSKYIEYKNSSKHFYLCGVVTNFGYSNNFGKFEAFCRIEKDGNWFNFSDEKVSESNWDDIHNNGIHYILFYHKI